MAGTPGACSQVFCHPIRCIARTRQDRLAVSLSYLYHTRHTAHTPRPQPQSQPQRHTTTATTTHNKDDDDDDKQRQTTTHNQPNNDTQPTKQQHSKPNNNTAITQQQHRGEEKKRREKRQERHIMRRDREVKNVSNQKISQTNCLIMIRTKSLRSKFSFESSEFYPCFQFFT